MIRAEILFRFVEQKVDGGICSVTYDSHSSTSVFEFRAAVSSRSETQNKPNPGRELHVTQNHRLKVRLSLRYTLNSMPQDWTQMCCRSLN